MLMQKIEKPVRAPVSFCPCINYSMPISVILKIGGYDRQVSLYPPVGRLFHGNELGLRNRCHFIICSTYIDKEAVRFTANQFRQFQV